MLLNFKKYGDRGSVILLLHGLFGSSANWKGFIQSWKKNIFGECQIFAIDLPNHGESFGLEEWTYANMAKQVHALMENQNLTSVSIIGHSMGGRVAMWLSYLYPQSVNTLVILDISPIGKPSIHLKTVFQGLNAINLFEIKNRGDAEKVLLPFISSYRTRQFLLKSVVRTNSEKQEEAKWEWKINLKNLSENQKLLEEGVASDFECNKKTLFVKGCLSDYIINVDYVAIQEYFPKSEIVEISDSGHWLHVEKPQGLMDLLNRFFDSL